MALYQCIKFHLFIFNSFRDMLRASLQLQTLERKINLLLLVIRVTVLALCTSSGGCLSIYQVSFDSLLYFQRYAPDKLLVAKIKKSNSVNIGDRVMVLAVCNFTYSPLSLYQVSFIYLQYF